MDDLGKTIGLLLLGLFLALAYFGGMWWTVRMLPRFRRPGMVLAVSTAVRLTIVIGVLALLITDHWGDFFICLLGFVGGRVLLSWYAAKGRGETASEPATGRPASADRVTEPTSGVDQDPR